MQCLQTLQAELAKLQNRETERSFYPLLKDFFIVAGEEAGKMKQEFNVIAEASSKLHESKVGFPDLTVQLKQHHFRTLGWVEVKLPQDNLNDERFKEQFQRYKDSLENLIITNLREWELWQWDKKEKPVKVAEALLDVSNYQPGSEKALIDLLSKFYNGKALEIRTPKQLALALARKARLLSQQVQDHIETALEKEETDNDLVRLRGTFSKTLVSDLKPHQFANMVAETLAYSLFLAALERDRRQSDETFTLSTALDYLPKSVPILSSLYTLTSSVAKDIPEIHYAVESLIEQLDSADIHKIHEKMIHHKQGDDPVIHFYEPFLAEYDPKEREARGVYYTPRPVVDYITRSVDWILKEKLGKKAGIADPDVHLLDPATGTGTFLMSAIELIHQQKEKQFGPLGDEIVRKEFSRIVQGHILKHFYGFELMIAPYAIAHLKLTMLLEEYGFNFDMTKDNDDVDDDRFKIYLTNSLEEPEKNEDDEDQTTMFSFLKPISQENRLASEVKNSKPVVAIIGNPPYSNFGRMNRNDWILGLLDDYKKNLNERKINLDDDFIKFIRFAQWKLEQTGQGVFAMITSNTFVDGITHRQMRRSLMDTFDEIYIYNLHGNSRKGEVAPDGGKDENVFNIMTGVSINIFVKHPERKSECVVKSCDLWGKRKGKFETLDSENFDTTKWKELSPKAPNWFFVERDLKAESEYFSYFSLVSDFNIYGSGVKTERDKVSINFDKSSLKATLLDFMELDEEAIRKKYPLQKDSRDWKILKAKQDVQENNASGVFLKKISYRPFDTRWTWYSGKTRGFVGTPGKVIGEQMNRKNLGLVTTRLLSSNAFRHIFCSAVLTESSFISNKTKEFNYVFPLYIYPDDFQEKVDKKYVSANFPREFIDIISGKLEFKFLLNGRGDLQKDFGAEDIFYYAYAIFHSPTYRERYAEQLKIDFPRLPLTSDKELFAKLVGLGNELVNLHLLGENPFDSSPTIFDDPQKWGVKIGGAKPEDLEDWKVSKIYYDEKEGKVYVNKGQYFEGVEKEVWEFMIGGYQVCGKWLKDRKKAERSLSVDDLQHYMKIVVSLRETIRIMKEIDEVIPGWPLK